MNARRSGRAALCVAVAVFLAGCPATGPLGPTSMTGYQIVLGPSTTVSAPLGVASALIATCPSPKVVVGGGYTTGNEAAKVFDVTQPRISNLMRGKIEVFGLDMLVNMLSAAGLRVTVQVKKAA